MRLLLPLLIGIKCDFDLYEIVEGTNDLRFRTDTKFYKEHIENNSRAGDCMQSGPFVMNKETGETRTFPGIFWSEQNGGLSPIDYEKCVYYVTGGFTTHSDAELQCEAQIASKCNILDCQGTLVSIHTEAQNDLIASFLTETPPTPSDGGKAYWIGMRQFCNNCAFENSDHSVVDFVKWQDEEPNNDDGNEDCVEYVLYDKKWNDNNCMAKRNFICQIYLDKDRQHPAPILDKNWPTTGGCKPGWTLFGKACFRIFASRFEEGNSVDGKSWNDAKADCAASWSGADLAILPNIHYQYFVNSMVRDNGRNIWIGLMTSTGDSTFHWVDGSRITYSFWEAGEPNNFEDKEDKVEIQWYNDVQFGTKGPGQWNDIVFHSWRSYLCYNKRSSSFPVTSGPICPDGWTQAPRVDSFCYKLVTNAPTGYDQAEEACSKLSSETGHTTHLASIEDIYEDNFIASLFYSKETNFDPFLGSSKPSVWIGLTGSKISSTSGTNIKWKWEDGFPTAYTRWGKNEPLIENVPNDPSKTCIYTSYDGSWYTDKSCNMAHSYVCKSNIAEIDPTYDVKDDRGALLDCPLDWHQTGGSDEQTGHHCMKAFKEEVSWFEANNRCLLAAGGHLVSIHSSEFDQRVRSLASTEFASKDFWIGMTRSSDGSMSWVDGSPSTYYNWAPGEPSVEWEGNAEECVEIWNGGTWNDFTCSSKRPFVCKTTRPMENCLDIPNDEKKQCGYAGITAYECESTLKCCYNGGDVFGVSCYQPKGRGSGSLTPGAAAGLASGIWLTLIGGIIVYFVFLKGDSGPSSFANPSSS